jgi:hypothetical protein
MTPIRLGGAGGCELNRLRLYTPSHQECGESAVEGEEGEVISQVIMVFLEYHHVGRYDGEGSGHDVFQR